MSLVSSAASVAEKNHSQPTRRESEQKVNADVWTTPSWVWMDRSAGAAAAGWMHHFQLLESAAGSPWISPFLLKLSLSLCGDQFLCWHFIPSALFLLKLIHAKYYSVALFISAALPQRRRDDESERRAILLARDEISVFLGKRWSLLQQQCRIRM